MLLGIAFSEHRVASDQDFRARTDHIAHRLQRYASVDFNPIIQAPCLADTSEIRDLIQRPRDKLLSTESGIHRHYEHVID